MSKFIRTFIYGLEDGESITVTIEGKEIVFTNDEPQQDVEVSSDEPTGKVSQPAE